MKRQPSFPLRAPQGPLMTLANMRQNGVRMTWAKCEACGHQADLNVEALAETLVVPTLGQPLRCSRCGGKELNTRPAWHRGRPTVSWRWVVRRSPRQEINTRPRAAKFGVAPVALPGAGRPGSLSRAGIVKTVEDRRASSRRGKILVPCLYEKQNQCYKYFDLENLPVVLSGG
jgi:hypothetical protein